MEDKVSSVWEKRLMFTGSAANAAAEPVSKLRHSRIAKIRFMLRFSSFMLPLSQRELSVDEGNRRARAGGCGKTWFLYVDERQRKNVARIANFLRADDKKPWWNGRHKGLKILRFGVRVQLPLPAPKDADFLSKSASFFDNGFCTGLSGFCKGVFPCAGAGQRIANHTCSRSTTARGWKRDGSTVFCA